MRQERLFMKLISFVVPCYNSQDYMAKCIRSLLQGGDEVEILIVDDGSKDKTATIADAFEKKYPDIIRAIHKENGGHGSAVNCGIDNATGLFFKVVDSDDWVAPRAYEKIMDTLRGFAERNEELDLLVSNFMYDKAGAVHKKVMRYHHYLPLNKTFRWKDTRRFPRGKYILMHSVIFRTGLLRECGLRLPEHTFYVDNIYVFEPLPSVKSIYYLDVTFYHYFIGRDDQSVHENVMIKRIDQQIKVNHLMLEYFSDHYDEIAKTDKLFRYMYNYLEIITAISSVLLIRSGTEENFSKKEELWAYIEKQDPRVYRRMREGWIGKLLSIKGKRGRRIVSTAYALVQKVYKFN